MPPVGANNCPLIRRANDKERIMKIENVKEAINNGNSIVITWHDVIDILTNNGTTVKDSVLTYADQHTDDTITIYSNNEIYLIHDNTTRALPLTGKGKGAWLSKRLLELLGGRKQEYYGDYAVVDTKYHNTYYHDTIEDALDRLSHISRTMYACENESCYCLHLFRWNEAAGAYIDRYIGVDDDGEHMWYDDACRLAARLSGL